MQTFTSISDFLRSKNYPEKKTKRFYSQWEIFPGFYIYSFENNSALGSNKLFIDAGLSDLKFLLEKIPGVIGPQGMTPNKTFEIFSIYPIDSTARLVSCGWKFQFSYKEALSSFLKACECFAEHGLTATSKLIHTNDVKILKATGRITSIETRVGQSNFRRGLIEYWRECAVTGLSCVEMLRASHIKPWAKSTHEEKLDVFNGLLLSPNFDALFDLGFVSFKDNGSIIISPYLSETDRICTEVSENLKLRKINGAHLKYLSYHRLHVFKI